MPQDMKIWRRNARAKLLEQLGGKCSNESCGSVKNLVIAHKVPLTEAEHGRRVSRGSNHRIIQYRREAAEGKVKLLCQRCNIRESVRLRRVEDDVPEEAKPF